MISRDLSIKGQSLYLYNLKPSVIGVFEGLKNCDVFLCANKNELDELLIKHLWVNLFTFFKTKLCILYESGGYSIIGVVNLLYVLVAHNSSKTNTETVQFGQQKCNF